MNSIELDRLHEQANENPAILNIVINELIKMGKKTTITLIKFYSIFNVTYEDIEDYILLVIFNLLKNYSKEKGSFADYSNYVLKKRITTKLVNSCSTHQNQVASLDDTTEDGTPLVELIADRSNQPIPDDISFTSFKLEMSSPKAKDNDIERKKRKVFKLIEFGLSQKEIMQILDLTPGKFRYLKDLIELDLIDWKNSLDLKKSKC